MKAEGEGEGEAEAEREGEGEGGAEGGAEGEGEREREREGSGLHTDDWDPLGAQRGESGRGRLEVTGAHLDRLEVRVRVRVRVTNPNQAVAVSKGRVRTDSRAAKCSVANTPIAPTLARRSPSWRAWGEVGAACSRT